MRDTPHVGAEVVSLPALPYTGNWSHEGAGERRDAVRHELLDQAAGGRFMDQLAVSRATHSSVTSKPNFS
jgi:hypothetical protein